MAKLTEHDELNVVADWKTGSYSQRELASKYNCSKGKISQLTMGIEKAQNDHVVKAQKTILTAKALLSNEEMTAIMNVAHNEIFNENLVTNASQLGLVRVIENLSLNKKQVPMKVKEYVEGRAVGETYEFIDTQLDMNDYKLASDTIDKLSITTKVNERFSSSNIKIDNTNATQVNLTTEEISRAIADGLPN